MHTAMDTNREANSTSYQPLRGKMGVYVKKYLIGKGAQGAVSVGKVIEAKSSEFSVGHDVALKTGNLSDWGVIREIKMFQKLVERQKESPQESYIVRYHEAIGSRQLNKVTLVLEYCSGEDLFQNIINSNGTYSEDRAAATIHTIALVLSNLMQWNIIHRDLKPENFVYTNRTDDKVLKLIDFGMSCFADESADIRNSAAGTLMYNPPESFNSEPATYASDIWSLGKENLISIYSTQYMSFIHHSLFEEYIVDSTEYYWRTSLI